MPLSVTKSWNQLKSNYTNIIFMKLASARHEAERRVSFS